MQKRVALPLIAFLVLLIVFGVGWWLYRASLVIEAQIIYNMGGPQPVARQSFYLLDTDPLSLTADDPKFKAKVDAAKNEDEKMNIQLSGVMLALLKNSIEKRDMAEKSGKTLLGTLELSKPFWEAHLVQSAQTDFKGHAVFENLKPGTYWLMGMTETRAAFAFWNEKISVGIGENKITLDQNNALYSK
ncbi:MAG TPA: hypothetical protein VF658_03950 [Pyrinomonadaceae bacterium]